MQPIKGYESYSISPEGAVFNAKGAPVKATSTGRVSLWNKATKKNDSLQVSHLWAEAYPPLPLLSKEASSDPWETEEAREASLPFTELPEEERSALSDPWTAKKSKCPQEVIHAICKGIQAGHKARVVRELVMQEFPDVMFTPSLVADIKGGWLHHDIVKQYGIKPQHRSLKKNAS